MNNNKKISILGCGWLGFPLAKMLLANGWTVKGSTTTAQKLPLLQTAGIEPFLIQTDNANSQLSSSFFNADVLFINIPPSRKTAQSGYLDKMQTLISYIHLSVIRKVIFISSTSVYGEVGREVTEDCETDNQSELLQAEKLFLSDKSFSTTVIRFGGLFGPERNPGRFFRDKKSIPNSLAPVNLIHLQDCLGLIESVLNQPELPGVFNAVAPSHPTKKDFYSKAILQSGFAVPDFVEEKTAWKIVSPNKIISALNYQYRYPDLLKCLDDPAAF